MPPRLRVRGSKTEADAVEKGKETKQKETRKEAERKSPSSPLLPLLLFLVSAVFLGFLYTQREIFTNPTPQSNVAESGEISSAKKSVKACSATEAIAHATSLKQSQPHLYLSELITAAAEQANYRVYNDEVNDEPKAAESASQLCNLSSQGSLVEALGDAYNYLKRYDEAIAARRYLLRLMDLRLAKAGRRPKGERMQAAVRQLQKAKALALVQLAQDQYLAFAFSGALKSIEAARGLLKPNMPPEAASVLLRLESTVHECAGDLVTSLARLEEGLHMLPRGSFELVQMHADLLKRTITATKGLPPVVEDTMRERLRALQDVLISRGPWERVDQLPRHQMPGLTAKPWHEISDHAHVRAARDMLVASAPALRAEFVRLRDAGQLMRERECIHDAGGGEWRRFEVTGFWRRLDPATNCSLDAPVACRVLQDLRAGGLPAIRAGYSAIGPHAWLKPHFGMTNAQLKLHLGLIVPGGNATATRCAEFRVGDAIRGWAEDEVIFFDDSFEHEVWNRCLEERVVFQVVFRHFDANATHAERLAAWLPEPAKTNH